MAYDVRSLTTTAGTGTTMTLTSPAGATSTDALFIFVVHGSGIQIVSNPPGSWSLGTPNAFNTNSTARVIQTSALATSGPWTFTFSASTAYAAAAVAITTDTAVGSQRPVIDTAQSKVVSPTTGAFVFPAITPSNTGDVVLWLGGWSRYTTMTPPGGVTEQAQVSTGTGSTDLTLWLGSQAAATTAGTLMGAISVTNDNPSGFTGEGQSMITVAFRSTPPPTTWVGDFETGDLSQYAFALEGGTDRITIQTDTPRQGSKYARFVAVDEDVYPLTPTENPRAQLVSPRLLFPGFERWIQFSVRFPVGFPTIPPGGWLVWFQWHGPPYTGSPSFGFGVEGDHINVERNVTYNFDTVWRAPMYQGTWVDFVMRVNFQQDETGFVELWMNGVQQIFTGGVRRLYMRTVELDQTTGLELDPTIYRLKGMFEAATIDFDGVRFDATPPATLALGNGPPARVLTGPAGTVRANTEF